ncbi:MAG: SAM-dependent methyltransferase, partial [Pyrinomonadaceae bacterium]
MHRKKEVHTKEVSVAAPPSAAAAGTLYLVATPIGNLQDLSARAMSILRAVNLIGCEDTRHSRTLLDHYVIGTKTVSYHDHNERERAVEFGDRLLAGESIAIISDAGMPGIADPGYRIVAEAIARNITIVPIPGAVALTSAL